MTPPKKYKCAQCEGPAYKKETSNRTCWLCTHDKMVGFVNYTALNPCLIIRRRIVCTKRKMFGFRDREERVWNVHTDTRIWKFRVYRVNRVACTRRVPREETNAV